MVGIIQIGNSKVQNVNCLVYLPADSGIGEAVYCMIHKTYYASGSNWHFNLQQHMKDKHGFVVDG